MSDHNATKLEFDIKEPAENTQTAEDWRAYFSMISETLKK
jgi:hypothetical protein